MGPRLEFIISLLILLGMLVSLCGLIVPIFPGLIVIWVLALLYGIIFGFGMLGAVLFVVITVLAILGEISDNLLMSKKARQEGARWLSIAFAFVAGIVCSIVFTPLAGIAAALGALFLAEFISSKDPRKALAVTKSMAIGWGWSFVARFGVGLMMIALWAIWAWA
ncbi:MAG: DUF456 domain-containing protein [Anaerolineae bacterium]